MANRVGRGVQLLQARINQADIPKIVILDPRHYTDNILSTDTKSKVVKIFVFLKKLSEKWFSHVLLLAFLILYACIGAAIFESIEGGYEKKQNAIIRELREPIYNLTDILTKELWTERESYPMPIGDGRYLNIDPDWDSFTRKRLSRFEQQVMATCRKGLDMGISQDIEITKWTFMGGLFFSMTVFTTIGYGDNPPKTTAGQAFTMVYAFLGIPLLLMVLADMGRIFTRGIKFVFKYFRRVYYMRSFRKVRRVSRSVGNMGRRATFQFSQVKYKDTAVNAFNKGIAFIPYTPKDKKSKHGLQKSPAFVVRNPGNKTPFIIRTDPTPPQTSAQSSPPETPMPEEYMEIDDEFDLPITLAIIILMIYLLIGAIIFWSTERWTLLHAFYFVFISMSTIGFGDFIPHNPGVLLAAFIYLLFGLALTSMCINVVQIKLSATFQKAKVLVGESIGLDVQQMMAEELAKEKEAKEKEKEKEKDKSRDTSVDKTSKESSVDKIDAKDNNKNKKPINKTDIK